MSRNAVLLLVILLSLSIVTTSGAMAMPTNTLTILPKDCKVMTGEELSLTLDGHIPSDAIVKWNVNSGTIVSILPGQNASFIAPSRPTVATIYASLYAGNSGMKTTIIRQCTITSLNRVPNGLANAAGIDHFLGD
jgi:hypothetical protein